MSGDELLLRSLATVGVACHMLAHEHAATGPVLWRARRFAKEMVTCSSTEDVVAVVERRPVDAVAFFNFCCRSLEMEDVVGWKWSVDQDAPSAAHPDVTACAHFALDVLNAIETAYPEGFTEIPAD